MALSVIRCNNNPLHQQRVGRRDQAKKAGRKERKKHRKKQTNNIWSVETKFNPYPTAFPYGNGMVLHFYQQQESSTTKTVHKVINKGLKTYV